MSSIISAFPGTGKSYLFNNPPDGCKFADSDSSLFSWEIMPDGTKIRHTEFPKNYISHILNLPSSLSAIFVSSHFVVREALQKQFINDLYYVYPGVDQKQDYIERFKRRNSPPAFIDLLDKNWVIWIDEMKAIKGYRKFELQKGQYLKDIILDILNPMDFY